MSAKGKWKEVWQRVCCRRRDCCQQNGSGEYYGLILVIVGLVTIGAFFIPSKIWLVVLSALMIYAGYRMFTD